MGVMYDQCPNYVGANFLSQEWRGHRRRKQRALSKVMDSTYDPEYGAVNVHQCSGAE